jgi:hypothetical protein
MRSLDDCSNRSVQMPPCQSTSCGCDSPVERFPIINRGRSQVQEYRQVARHRFRILPLREVSDILKEDSFERPRELFVHVVRHRQGSDPVLYAVNEDSWQRERSCRLDLPVRVLEGLGDVIEVRLIEPAVRRPVLPLDARVSLTVPFRSPPLRASSP